MSATLRGRIEKLAEEWEREGHYRVKGMYLNAASTFYKCAAALRAALDAEGETSGDETKGDHRE